MEIMIMQRATFLVSSLLILVIGLLTVHGQRKEIALNDRRITIRMERKPLQTVFARLIFKYDIAIGFEESILDRDHRRYDFETNIPLDDEYSGDKELPLDRPQFFENLITVDFADARLADVMNSIVKQMHYYDWRTENGVVNIFPIRGRDPKLTKLLDLRVHAFAVGEGVEEGDIQARIMLFLPEFRAFLAENRLEEETGRRPLITEAGNALTRHLRKEMRFSNLTFKELLNAITKAKRGGWILRIKKLKSESRDKEFVELLI